MLILVSTAWPKYLDEMDERSEEPGRKESKP
jgi:hypothetical protein